MFCRQADNPNSGGPGLLTDGLCGGGDVIQLLHIVNESPHRQQIRHSFWLRADRNSMNEKIETT